MINVPKPPQMGKIVSSCRDCVFATYRGGVQEGCTLGRIDAFEEQGVAVVGIDDGHLKYLTIDRFCNMCHSKDSRYLAGVPQHLWEGTVRDFVKVRAAYVVVADGGSSLAGLRHSLGWALRSAIRPRQLYVALTPSASVSRPMARAVIEEMDLGLSWRVVGMEPGDDTAARLYKEEACRAFDACISQLDDDEITYYVPVVAGSHPPDDLLVAIDRAINDRMVPLGVVMDGGLVVAALTKLHKHPEVVGNKGLPLVDKLDWVRETYGSAVLISSLEELR